MDDISISLNYIRDSSTRYAKAKGERIFLDRTRKSLIAELKIEAELSDPKKYSSDAKQDTYARAHIEYKKFLLNLKAAIEIETELYQKIKAAEYNIEVWRSKESTRRSEMNLT